MYSAYVPCSIIMTAYGLMTYVEAHMLLCTHCMYKIPLIETAHTIMMMHIIIIIIVPIAILALPFANKLHAYPNGKMSFICNFLSNAITIIISYYKQP